MGWRDYQEAAVRHGNTNNSFECMEKEYYQLLTRWWKIDDDPAATDDEARILLARLDELYQGLHRKGCKVPVRLPIEQKAA